MKKTFTPQERDAFAKAVSGVEGIFFTAGDDQFFESLLVSKEPANKVIKRVIERALAKP